MVALFMQREAVHVVALTSSSHYRASAAPFASCDHTSAVVLAPPCFLLQSCRHEVEGAQQPAVILRHFCGHP